MILVSSQLAIDAIAPNIYWVHKPPTRGLESSNGLLICGVNQNITVDLNLPRPDTEELYRFLGDRPHTAHINTHLHLDHVTHLHLFQEHSSCEIYVPEPDAPYFEDITLHRKHFGYDQRGLAENWMNLTFKEFQFSPVKSFQSFSITSPLRFGEITLQPISFPGHGPAHVGFHITCGPCPPFSATNNQVLFYSDIGIDIGGQQFGPWYGFRTLKVKEVRADVDRAEEIHRRLNLPMVSSHGPLYPTYSPEPYAYIREKLQQREQKIIDALKKLGGTASVADLLPLDLFYPKRKMSGNLLKLVAYWEEGFLENHLLDLTERGVLSQEGSHFSLKN
jgi:glyoxylase-like metal-dependent hydrolase (beta-lactamase superfamily II)